MLAKMSSDDFTSHEEIQEAFEVFDTDGSGHISVEEFRVMMTTLGEKMSHDEVNELLRIADRNGDDRINAKVWLPLPLAVYILFA